MDQELALQDSGRDLAQQVVLVKAWGLETVFVLEA
jgi:hypothetical protein